MSYYRLTVIVCALCWFLVGLHVPTLHGFTHHDQPVPWFVVGVVATIAAVGVAILWSLLLRPALHPQPPGTS